MLTPKSLFFSLAALGVVLLWPQATAVASRNPGAHRKKASFNPMQALFQGIYRPRAPRVYGRKPRVTVCADPTVIRRVIRKHSAAFRRCYKGHVLTRHPKRAGLVKVKFTIGPRGRVIRAVVRSSALRDRPTERCLEKALRAMRFPRSGATLHVIYPFVFKP